MFIRDLSIKNYRTIEDLSIHFNGYYTAISGKNNAGKSNILRAIRSVLYSGIQFRIRGNSILGITNFDWKDEITSWKKESKEDIYFSLTLEIDKKSDTAIYKFLTDLILKESAEESSSETESLTINFFQKPTNEKKYSIFLGNTEITDDYKKKELLKRIESAECLSFHNSTSSLYSPFEDSVDRISDFMTPSDIEEINKKKDDLMRLMSKNLKSHQQKLTKWLGALEEKYEVCLSVQGLNFEREPIDISLKEKGGDVTLDNWGSGTRNRTLIFLKLFNASTRAEKESETDRIKPVVIIEEPESFLHPQAQAEFGRVLQDLAKQFQIQVIVTTHSPYFLSYQAPVDNILLSRKKIQANPCTSVLTTDGPSWCEPFIEALGIKSEDYGPMKDIIFNDSSNILLVEGDIDRKYLEYLQKEIHGANALNNNFDIFPVGGADSYKNTVWINFVKSKYRKVAIMVDLDKSNEIKKALTPIGFKENQNLFIVGTEEIQCIEGIAPKKYISEVFAENPDISLNLMNTNRERSRSAKSSLKTKLLDKITSNSSTEGLEEFYALTKKLNKYYK